MITPVKGRRSPRWAVWSRMLIPCQSGLQYLARLRVFQCPLFGIYVHDIFEPDGDRDGHSHPWSFASFVLRGHYVERVYPEPEKNPSLYITYRHGRFSLHTMGRHDAHRIVEASPGLKTLIFTGPRSKDGWGYFVDGTYVPWQEYEHLAPAESGQTQ